jgi:hypothetical protein
MKFCFIVHELSLHISVSLLFFYMKFLKRVLGKKVLGLSFLNFLNHQMHSLMSILAFHLSQYLPVSSNDENEMLLSHGFLPTLVIISCLLSSLQSSERISVCSCVSSMRIKICPALTAYSFHR